MGAVGRPTGRGIGLWTAAVVTLTACSSAAPPVSVPQTQSLDEAKRVRAVAAEYGAGYARAFPELVEYVGGKLAHHDTLSDNSLSALRAWQEREDGWRAELARIDVARLVGTPEWALHGTLTHALKSAVAGRVCRAELWPAHQFGWQSTLLAVLDQQPLGTAALREEALKRWQQLPRFLSVEADNLREGVRLGYTAPRRNVELALAQLDALLAPPSPNDAENDSPLLRPARRDSDPAFRERWLSLVQTELVPAITSYRDFLRDEHLPKARTTVGIAELPNGAECYRARLEKHTTRAVAPEQVYELGQRRVAEREAKALELARAVFGASVTDLRAAQQALTTDPRNRFTSIDEAVRFVDQALARAQSAAPRWFPHLPRAPLVLVPYDAFEAKSHPGARYEPAAADGSRPARFRIDLTDLAALQRAPLEHTVFHEAIPGHHLQIGLQQDLARREESLADSKETPLFDDGLGAFYEGWARYGEGLAEEMGLYSSDLDRFGAVSHLPTGLVVDPGIHARGWSRESAIAWALQKQVSFSPADAAAYVDRIAVCPGEMVSYGFGELELIALRKEAATALGGRFEVKAFHDRVLSRGAIPLSLLREQVMRWIRDQAGSTMLGRAEAAPR